MSNGYLPDYTIGERVYIDGDDKSLFTITGVLFRRAGTTIGVGAYEVSWITKDAQRTAWVEEYRITGVEDRCASN